MQRLLALTHDRFGLFPFRSPLLREKNTHLALRVLKNFDLDSLLRSACSKHRPTSTELLRKMVIPTTQRVFPTAPCSPHHRLRETARSALTGQTATKLTSRIV
jgi:hypothetical protein